MNSECLTKGKKNKLKVGQKVKAKPSLIHWHATHLCWSLSTPAPNNSGYDKNDREIEEDNLKDVYVWSRAKLSGEMPFGIVSHYGSEDEFGKKPVWVEFTFKTELGNIPLGTYVEEKYLVLTSKKK